MRLSYRIQQLKEIFSAYNFPEPFAIHLKNYFRQNPKLGGRDRKQLRQLAFNYLRLKNLFHFLPFEQLVALGILLYNDAEDQEAKAFLEPSNYGNLNPEQSFAEKLETVKKAYPQINFESIFPWLEHASDKFRNDDFLLSHLKQPLVWIRIQNGKEAKVEKELAEKSIYAIQKKYLSRAFAQDEKLTETESFKRGYFWIQDLSTQTASEYFKAKPNESWWDCCAGAGGKTLCLLDDEPTVNLYASDIRPNILQNLLDRQKLLGKGKINTFSANLEYYVRQQLQMFDGIVADLPCTGSGTWARTPEVLSNFDANTIDAFRQKQIRIITNVLPFLKPGKPLVYITCSVFKAENEDVINELCKTLPLKVDEQKYINGYKHGAENIFLCRLIKTEQ